ncbi:YicC family protein [Kiloniella laminariae]|uniref:YicC family protein n=1 Tax=Kiloniella laminariae TaxID=454162 RepID=A0ABT4LHG7_9PROT|nr:YicC/YloC family endoribonuclease [Kiloniella laminariae]MCZ4280395.1 YicC family protein [Kiloniella laminariae]
MGKAIASMTGFARAEGEFAGTNWSWELKSVNGKNLEVRCRVPNGYEALDAFARSTFARHFKRGNFHVGLVIDNAQKAVKLQVNEEILQQVIPLATRVSNDLDAVAPSVDGILNLRGVLELVEEEESPEDSEQRLKLIEESLSVAITRMEEMRRIEGTRMAEVAQGHIDEIERLQKKAGDLSATQPDALQARFMKQMAELLKDGSPVPEERLAQEIAILVTKADIREELDRLAAHVAAARDLLNQGGPCGRRLDFLCQEFNREANTLCSKSSDVALTTLGIDLKATIEQLREQIQNIE